MLDLIRAIKEDARMLAGILMALAVLLEALVRMLETRCDDP